MKCLKICVCLFVSTMSLCQAAHFMPVHEMTYCNSDAVVQSDTEGPYDDPQGSWHANDNYVSSWQEIWNTAQASGYSTLNVQIDPFTGDYNDALPVVNFYSYSESEVFLTANETTQGILAQGWANSATVAPGNATGNFYQILPDNDENTGDMVTVTIYYYGNLSMAGNINGTYAASISGGFAGDDVLITRNCQDYDDPQESEILHRFERFELGGHIALQEEYQETYHVAIGDILGIHAGVGTHTELTAIDSEQLSAYAHLGLGLVIESYDGPAPFDPAKADLNGDGKVNLADFALFASTWLWEE